RTVTSVPLPVVERRPPRRLGAGPWITGGGSAGTGFPGWAKNKRADLVGVLVGLLAWARSGAAGTGVAAQPAGPVTGAPSVRAAGARSTVTMSSPPCPRATVSS